MRNAFGVRKGKSSIFVRMFTGFLLFAFGCHFIALPQYSQAATAIDLPAPEEISPRSEVYFPPIFQGIRINPQDPLMFDFLVNRGDDLIAGENLRLETEKMAKYFLAALTIPDAEGWVNLSPYEGDRVIPTMLARTEMGKDMLSQDYLLKQVSSSLTNPETDLGQAFWQKVFARAYEQYGTTEVPVNTFNKVWIVPSEAVVIEEDGSALVVKSHLKVMLDQDYTALKENLRDPAFDANTMPVQQAQDIASLSSDVVRELILPELEQEINEGKNFAPIRQVYNAVILATWFKRSLRESLLGKVYMDQGKIAGIDVEDKDIKDKIYDRYMEAFRKGAYNLIKEDYDLTRQEILPRKYFSGGVVPIGQASSSIIKVYRASNPAEAAVAVSEFNDTYGRMTDLFNGFVSYTVRLFEEDEYQPIQVYRSELEALNHKWTEPQNLKTTLQLFFGEENLQRLGEALARGDTETAEAIVKSVNTQEILPLLNDNLQQAEKIWLDDVATEDAQQLAVQKLAQGKTYVHIIAGGAATRMASDLKDKLGLQLPDQDLKIWNLDVWQILKAIKNLDAESFKKDVQTIVRELQAMPIPEYAQSASIGVRALFAMHQSVKQMTNNPQLQQAIFRNMPIVINVNEEIQEQVERDLIEHKFFGFNPNRVFLTFTGYGPQFRITETGEIELVEEQITWNHGSAWQESLWNDEAPYHLNPKTGERVYEGKTLDAILDELGVESWLARRINDGGLLFSEQAIDLKIIAALEHLHAERGVEAVFETGANLSGNKGGLALQTENILAFILEGSNAADPDIQKRLDELTEAAIARGQKGIPYNRLYAVGLRSAVKRAIFEHGGMPVTLKLKNGFISFENAFSDVSRYVQALTVNRNTDIYVDKGISPALDVPGAAVRDIKTLVGLVEGVPLHALLDSSDERIDDVVAQLPDPATSFAEGQDEALSQLREGRTSDPYGGIDFTPEMLRRLVIKRNGDGVPLVDQDFENIDLDGLYPVTIDWAPATVTTFPILMHLSAANEAAAEVGELSAATVD